MEIDNNTSERTLRLAAIGRKNWMVLGSDQGGETAATLFSILANAKRYRIEPFAYVRALLIALSSDEVDLESLLPDVWIAAHPEHFLSTAAMRRRRPRMRVVAVGSDAGRKPRNTAEAPEIAAVLAGVCPARG